MNPKIYIDIEPLSFAASRRHEYEFQLSEYVWTYHTRIDYCCKDLVGRLNQLEKHAPNHTQVLCLGHKSNFRYAIYPRYKSNRRGIRRAAGYNALREWLADNYESVRLPNVEADDVLGIMAGKAEAADKDLALALELSPLDPMAYAMISSRALTHLQFGDIEAAADYGERAALTPGAHKHIKLIAACTAHLAGRGEQAAQWLARTRADDPELSVSTFFRAFPFGQGETREAIERSMRELGL